MLQILFTFLIFTVAAFSFVGVAAFLRWLYSMAMWSARKPRRRSSEPASDGLALAAILAARVPDAPPGSPAAQAREKATRVNAEVRRAHLGAWLVYAAIVVWGFLAHTSLAFEDNVRLAIGYGVLAPQLQILLWELGLSYRRRLLVFLLYLATGVALLAPTTNYIGMAKIAFFVGVVGVIPMGGLPALFIRWLPPFLGFLIAAVIEIFGIGLLLEYFGFAPRIETPQDLQEIKPQWVILGLGNMLLGPLLAWLLLRQRRWMPATAGVAGVIAALLLDRDLVQRNLPHVVRIICFVAVGILKALILWGVFKFFVWLQERWRLTSGLVQVHLCWTFLTAYFALTTLFEHPFYQDPGAVGRGVVLALALHTLVLHLLLFLVRRRHRAEEPKRLLVLRVFGQPNEREDLLDDLDDTWRRIGAVDLLAASDVAMHTLEAHVLEMVLLHREDAAFLKSEEAVDKRIAQQRSGFDTDVRHAVHPFYCHEGVWRYAFEELAKRASVVLMDLRGFTPRNKGCEIELTHLLRQKERPPLVLLVDSDSDRPALEQIVQKTGARRDFTTLDFDQRSPAERRALFELLLTGAFSPSG